MSKPHIPQGVLSTEPNLPDAEQTWHHWYRTFQRYLQVTHPAPDRTEGQSAQQFQAATSEHDLVKLDCLHRYITFQIYNYISDCTDYNSAIEILRRLYVKPRNIVFNIF